MATIHRSPVFDTLDRNLELVKRNPFLPREARDLLDNFAALLKDVDARVREIDRRELADRAFGDVL